MKKLLGKLLIIPVFIVGLSLIEVTPNKTTFGFFAGMCDGNCATMYEVSDKTILVDTTSFWDFRFKDEKLEILGQKIINQEGIKDYDFYKLRVPLIMILDPRSGFGCPDCYDQGGYFFEFEILGIKRQFQIDKGEEPIYYQNITDDIRHNIKIINEQLIK
ncbi:hypothetical protein WAF17_12060 [Bernardetia sp. ABR2-2B]|uniref:hypothetical protein n=1 Tax=Bernardetia sp. ABR2-2B TaxID=3127472 RepID=UPI0030D46358